MVRHSSDTVAMFCQVWLCIPHCECLSVSTCWCADLPERRPVGFHLHSSLLQHCQTVHDSWVQRRGSPAVSWQRTRTHPPPPDKIQTVHISHWKAKSISTAIYAVDTLDNVVSSVRKCS